MKQNRMQKNQTGFTLVEILASIVILSVIFIGIFQLFMFTSKTATSNNTKLVTTHMAKATIERIKIDHESFFQQEKVKPDPIIYTKNNCEPNHCEQLYEFFINDNVYEVEVKISQNANEKDLELINVVVTVEQIDKKVKSKVEGYVIYEASP